MRTEDLETFPAGAPQQVDLAQIEPALRDLWRTAAKSGDTCVTRTALLNLVVVTPHTAAAFDATLRRIAAHLPCRVLVLETATRNAAAPAQAAILAHCRPAARGGKQVCCERVTLQVEATATASVASTVLGLLLPDLPTCLFVAGTPGDAAALVPRLGPWVDRWITDSSGFATADTDVRMLAAWTAADPRLEIVDVGWLRLDPWRELLAALFDAPPFDAALARIQEVTLEHAHDGRVAALWFAGWLMSRLGWHVTRGGGDRFTLAGPQGGISLRLQRLPALGSGLRCVTLQADDAARYVVACVEDSDALLESRIETEITCPLPQRLAVPPAAADALLLQLLVHGHRHVAFEHALAAAAQLASATATA